MARVTIHDMLSPLVRVTREVEVRRMSDLLAELAFDDGLYRPVVVRNGLVMEPGVDFEILGTDFVAVQLVPQKDVLRTVALIAVTAIAAAIIGPWAAGLVGWTSKVGVAVMSAIASAASASLVNAVLPPSVADRKTGGSIAERSSMYGWSVQSNDAQEGDAVPRLFGELTFPPKLISSYIETVNDKQYFNGLYLVNDGPVDWIADVTLNKTPATVFEGVTIETRYGAEHQSQISSFLSIRHDKTVGTKLANGGSPVSVSTDGNSVETVRIELTFPQGLYKIDMDGKDAGEQEPARWTVYSQFSPDTGAHWYEFAAPQRYEANTRSPLRRTIVRSGLPRGAYQVRVWATYDTNDGGSQHSSEVWFDYMQEETSDQLSYPGRSLIALRALATDKLNGQRPVVRCRAKAGSSSPADISLVMLRDCGISEVKIDTPAFDEWRQDCLDRSFSCNVLFDTVSSLRECLDVVSTLGRARVEQFGSRYSVIMDKPGQLPVQGFTFGVGNIDKDSFAIDTVPTADRANVIDVTYYPKDDDNERATFEVSSSSYNTDEQERRSSINLIGCDNLDMATRHANYLLKCNQYLTIMPSWGADLDAIVCRVGDIVSLSHDVPAWGQSGLVVSGSTTGVVLDREVEMEPDKRYAVQIRDCDDNTIFEKEVCWTAGASAELRFVAPSVIVPALHDAYSFGEVGKVSNLVRLTGIQTTGTEMRRKLVALEYVPEVYTDGAVVVVPSIEPELISHVQVTDFIRYGKDSTIETVLSVSWHGAAMSYTVSFKGPSDVNFTSTRVYDSNFSAVIRDLGVYQVRIEDGRGTVVDRSYTVLGKLAPPGTVPWLMVEQGRLTWGDVSDIDLAGYQFRYVFGDSDDWARGTDLFTGLVSASPLSVPVNLFGLVTIMVKAVDTSGVESEAPASVTVDLGTFAPNNVLSLYDQDDLSWPGELAGGTLSPWPMAVGTSVMWSDDDQLRMWSLDPESRFWTDQYSAMSYLVSIPVTGHPDDAMVGIQYGWKGVSLRVEYRLNGTRRMWSADPAALMWGGDDGESMWSVGAWLVWPGRVVASDGEYDFRFSFGEGPVRGELEYLAVVIDRADHVEYLDDIPVTAAGTRLALSGTYSAVRTVHVQIVGGTGRYVDLLDKDPSGPLIRVRTAAGDFVDAVVDATITSY